MSSGIYALVNKETGMRYIGQSVDLDKRKTTHFWELKNGRHKNSHLQRAWNKGERFEFLVIEKCAPEKCNEREVYWINHYNSIKNGYNQCEGGGTTTGYRFTEEQKKKISKSRKGQKRKREDVERGKETLRKHLESDPEFAKRYHENKSKAMIGREAWNKGRPHTQVEKDNLSRKLKGRYISEEHKEKLRELYSGEKSLTAKLKKSDVVEIRCRFLQGETQKEIAEDYPVTRQTIFDIVSGRRWKSVPNTLEELKEMQR